VEVEVEVEGTREEARDCAIAFIGFTSACRARFLARHSAFDTSSGILIGA
jgi:hypothetical protein